MVRRGGFGHFGAGGHEGVVEELTVIARVSHHVDDAHAFFFSFFSFLPLSFFSFLSCVLVVVCKISGGGRVWIAGTVLDFGEFFSFFSTGFVYIRFLGQTEVWFGGLKLLYLAVGWN